MNTYTTYGQTFSKGQLTIPKKIRELYGLGVDFAYKIIATDKKIIIEPQDVNSQEGLLSALTSISEPIFNDQDYNDWQEMRKTDVKRLKRLDL